MLSGSPRTADFTGGRPPEVTGARQAEIINADYLFVPGHNRSHLG
ncbi:hypothetical protein FBY34_6266 [Streptomyces sp. SLBN-115]|nr:hypothetical protein FBY34_6266 [Streptomyces sp. SLBN-115]